MGCRLTPKTCNTMIHASYGAIERNDGTAVT
jgi:hypothetical protein